MEEKKEFLEEWNFEDNFEKPIHKNKEKKMLNKKTKREITKEDSNKNENEQNNKEDENKLEKEKEHVGVIIGDAADLTDEQKIKRELFFTSRDSF